MRSFFSVAAALSLLAGETSAHYIFQQVSVGGTEYGVFEGVREHMNGNSPVTGKMAPLPSEAPSGTPLWLKSANGRRARGRPMVEKAWGQG